MSPRNPANRGMGRANSGTWFQGAQIRALRLVLQAGKGSHLRIPPLTMDTITTIYCKLLFHCLLLYYCNKYCYTLLFHLILYCYIHLCIVVLSLHCFYCFLLSYCNILYCIFPCIVFYCYIALSFCYCQHCMYCVHCIIIFALFNIVSF